MDWVVESGEEARLRLALREMRARAAAWKLSDAAHETLRRHLAASCWRTVGDVIADPERSVGEALLCLGELDQTEREPQRRLWLAWARSLLAIRAGDETARAAAVQALNSTEPWVQLRDGLSLSLSEARRLLEKPTLTKPNSSAGVSSTYAQSPQWTWVFQPKGQADLQRWCLTPDGTKLLLQDSAARLYAVDRVSGRLLWDQRLNVAGWLDPAGGG